MTAEKSTIVGLTGSIGMGKTTTAKMFADIGIPVWDADKVVHRLYANDKDVFKKIIKLCPQAAKNNIVDRQILKNWIAADGQNLKKLEDVVHPLIAKDRDAFLKENEGQLVVLDIPLLYEMNLENLVDYVIVVTASAEAQRQRVLDRKTMSQEQFDLILSKQMPDIEKRNRADFVIETTSLESASLRVEDIVKTLKDQICA